MNKDYRFFFTENDLQALVDYAERTADKVSEPFPTTAIERARWKIRRSLPDAGPVVHLTTFVMKVPAHEVDSIDWPSVEDVFGFTFDLLNEHVTVMIGNPVDGFSCNGIFGSTEEAVAWAGENVSSDADWWPVSIHSVIETKDH